MTLVVIDSVATLGKEVRTAELNDVTHTPSLFVNLRIASIPYGGE
jgi:hypothetical protein